MEKIGTPECQMFIAAHYAQNDIDTDADDWILEKKYKNFHGFTCRDFYHPNLDIRAVVVAEPQEDKYELTVLENASYQMFLEQMGKKPLFYYVPVVSNDGLVFYFEKTMTFDATGELETNKAKQTPYLFKKLNSLFKADEIYLLEHDHTVCFPKHTVEEIVYILENNNLSYNEKIFPLLNSSKYKAFNIDSQLEAFQFPEDSKLNNEQTIEAIFSIVSLQRDLTKEELSRIKKLLKQLPQEEIDSIENIMMSFRPKDDKELQKLIKDEESHKHNLRVWKKILENKSSEKK